MGLAPQGEIKAQKCQDNQRRDKDHKKDQFQSCNGISGVLWAVFAFNPFLCRTVSVRRHWFIGAVVSDRGGLGGSHKFARKVGSAGALNVSESVMIAENSFRSILENLKAFSLFGCNPFLGPNKLGF
jgi:hypothetical protein